MRHISSKNFPIALKIPFPSWGRQSLSRNNTPEAPPTVVSRQVGVSPRRSGMLWGVFTRRERWGVSWRGWLILALGAVLFSYVLVFRVYPFLAITQRVDSRILVVEGWMDEYAIRA